MRAVATNDVVCVAEVLTDSHTDGFLTNMQVAKSREFLFGVCDVDSFFEAAVQDHLFVHGYEFVVAKFRFLFGAHKQPFLVTMRSCNCVMPFHSREHSAKNEDGRFTLSRDFLHRR